MVTAAIKLKDTAPWKERFDKPSSSSVAEKCLIHCDPMDYNTLGFLVHHQLQEHVQTHVH